MQHASPRPSSHTQAAAVAGIDWATETNALCIIDRDGQVLRRLTAPADAAGIRRLLKELAHHGVTQVAIERPDGPVVNALLGAGHPVVVIAPRQVKHLRTRHGSAGNKDDRFDAYVLADTLRTDAHRLQPLQPDSPATVALRAAVRARTDLVETRVALCNQLRAHLRTVFPGAVGLFADLDAPISLAFLARFPSAQAAAWLSHRRLGAWLAANHYSGRTPTRVLLARLTDAPAGLGGDHGHAAAHTTTAYVAALRAICEQITALEAQIAEQLTLHPDAVIFQSLPRSCDKKLREAVMDFAADSRRASPWAQAIYQRHRTLGKTHQHATRILARAWLRVIWRCWQNHTRYNPALHGIAKHQHLPLTT
jgi:transposase